MLSQSVLHTSVTIPLHTIPLRTIPKSYIPQSQYLWYYIEVISEGVCCSINYKLIPCCTTNTQEGLRFVEQLTLFLTTKKRKRFHREFEIPTEVKKFTNWLFNNLQLLELSEFNLLIFLTSLLQKESMLRGSPRAFFLASWLTAWNHVNTWPKAKQWLFK